MNRKHNYGMTLIEVMFSVAIFTVVMGIIMTFALGFGDTAQLQNVRATGNDEARRALQSIVPDLRQAIGSTINWDSLPGEMLSYRVPEDVDGNGLPVDMGGQLEMGAPRVIGRDLEDINYDGLRSAQLAVTSGDTFRVLANHLSPESESPGAEGVFGPEQDANGNGQLDRGVWFEPFGNGGILITVQAQGDTRRGHTIRTTLQEIVYPRN